MRSTTGAIVNPCKIPENYVNPISAQRQTDGRRAGLKIRRCAGEEFAKNLRRFGAVRAVTAYPTSGSTVEDAEFLAGQNDIRTTCLSDRPCRKVSRNIVVRIPI